jgi:hypothetical protein
MRAIGGLSRRVEYKHDEKPSVRLQAGLRLIRKAAQAADQAEGTTAQNSVALTFWQGTMAIACGLVGATRLLGALSTCLAQAWMQTFRSRQKTTVLARYIRVL